MPSSACTVAYRYLHSFPTRRSSDLMNNASYREITFPSNTGVPTFVAQTRRTRPAILAWSDNDPLVTATPVDTTEGGYQTRYWVASRRSEEHTSELQSHSDLVCRLLLAPSPTDIYTLSLHDALPIS